MTARPQRIALVGIDGSGKSTLARLLAAERGYEVLSSLRNHESPGAPLQELSLTLDAMASAVDQLGSPDLKLALLYLQMCMFGPTERFRAMSGGLPRKFVSDRHPVIDAAVYLPVFRPMLQGAEHARSVLEKVDSAALKQAVAWTDAQARRLGQPLDLCTIATDLTTLVDEQLPEQLRQLAVRLHTTLPDAVIHLDISVAEALRRIARRGNPRESHETSRHLRHLQTSYASVLAALTPIPIHTIQVDHLTPTEVLHKARQCL
jgi:thymidylate kinase